MTIEEKLVRIASLFTDFSSEELKILIKIIQLELKSRTGAESEVK